MQTRPHAGKKKNMMMMMIGDWRLAVARVSHGLHLGARTSSPPEWIRLSDESGCTRRALVYNRVDQGGQTEIPAQIGNGG
jgi:hypothetical protein